MRKLIFILFAAICFTACKGTRTVSNVTDSDSDSIVCGIDSAYLDSIGE